MWGSLKLAPMKPSKHASKTTTKKVPMKPSKHTSKTTTKKFISKNRSTLCLLEEGTPPTHLLRVVWVVHECVVAVNPVVERLALPGASYLRNWDDANPVTLENVVCACVECERETKNMASNMPTSQGVNVLCPVIITVVSRKYAPPRT